MKFLTKILVVLVVSTFSMPKANAFMLFLPIAYMIDFKYEHEVGDPSDMPYSCGNQKCTEAWKTECGWGTIGMVITFPVCLLGNNDPLVMSEENLRENGYTEAEAKLIFHEVSLLKKTLKEKGLTMIASPNSDVKEVQKSLKNILPISDLTTEFLAQ